jgi:hypothetical protein
MTQILRCQYTARRQGPPMGRDGACLPASEVFAEMVPGDACPSERPATAVLIPPAEADLEILEGEPLCLVADLQTQRRLAHAALQERLGVGLLPAP